MNVKKPAREIRARLKKKASARHKKGAQSYFKEGIRLHGVPLPAVRTIAKSEYPKLRKQLGYDGLLKLCEELMRSRMFEEQIVAMDFLRHYLRKLDERDFSLFEKWLDRYIKNWATCDELSAHLFGSIIERKPFLVRRLLLWTRSKNRWKRRAAAVSLVIPARRGLFLKDVFAVVSKLMMDKDVMVQKGVGWLLKESSKKHQKEVVRFLLKWNKKTPRLILRIACEKVGKQDRKRVMTVNRR